MYTFIYLDLKYRVAIGVVIHGHFVPVKNLANCYYTYKFFPFHMMALYW